MGFGPPDADSQQQPSAPPLENPPAYPYSVPHGYPVVAAGTPVVQPAQQPHYAHPASSAAGLPGSFALPSQPSPAVAHPNLLPSLQPPGVHVVEQHTYVHLPAPDEPLITRSSYAAPRQITCPACFSQGPTVVTRQSGCCTYLACFGLCWVCCPLFWLPFCLDCDKDLVHTCSCCKQEVARMGPCS